MSVSGIIINNSGGTLQIDSNTSVMSFMGKVAGTASAGNALIGDGFGISHLNYGIPRHAVVATSSVSRTRQLGPFNDQGVSSIVLFNPLQNTTSDYQAYFFDVPSPLTTNYGIEIYNEQGLLVFNSGRRVVRVVDSITLPASHNYNIVKTYQAGRTYAVIAPDVYQSVQGNVVTFFGTYRPSTTGAPPFPSVSALVVDVTGY